MDNFGFRYFDWELGRFVQRDPSGYPDGPNNYLYCHNNPINFVDPLGLEERKKKDIIPTPSMTPDLDLIKMGLNKAANATGSKTLGFFSGWVDEAHKAHPANQAKYLIENATELAKQRGLGSATKYVAGQAYEAVKEGAGTNDFVRMADYEGKYSFFERAWFAVQGTAKSFLVVIGGVQLKRMTQTKYGPSIKKKVSTAVEELKEIAKKAHQNERGEISISRKIPESKLKYKPGKRGNAPIGEDGKPIELHHENQELGNASPRVEMTRTDHRGKGNFTANHPNTGKSPSKVDRIESANQHRNYWKQEWDNGRFQDLSDK